MYFGEIIWLEEPLNENGEPKVNENSPNAADHDDPIIGLRVLKDFTSEGMQNSQEGLFTIPKMEKPTNVLSHLLITTT